MNLYNNEDNLTIELDEDLSSFQTKMIKNNLFNEFATFKPEVLVDTNKITYDIKNYITIDDAVLKHNVTINKEKIEREFRNLENKINEYMLNKNNILIRKDTIFLNENELINNNEFIFKFIYVPVKNNINEFDKEKEYILNSEDLYVNKINKNDLMDKQELLEAILNEDEAYDIKRSKFNLVKLLIIIAFMLLLIVFKNNKTLSIITLCTFIVSLFIMYVFKITDDEKEYDNQYDDNTLLICNFPYIRKSLLDDKIYVNKDDFKIGKDKNNDCVIAASGVSRKHAHIIKKNNNYYIEDNNSTNHTYVNDEEIKVGTLKMLISGDKIKFGKEQYVFYCEV